ncbi:MFS transporter [Melioribacter sp. OK-6-Me]|uniref:MFS transporter n=1 Tax=unclassified Melioribacter TaxID=2627329 RepID=UPI003ED8BF99
MFKKIPPTVIVLGVISFFTDFASEMLYPVTPLFLTAALGSSMAVVGLIEGLAEMTAGFMKGYFGVLSDKIGRRKIFVQTGYGLSGIVKSLPGIFPFVTTVFVSRIVDRIGKGIRTSPRDALLGSYSNENNSGTVFGFHRSMDTLGAVAGPLAAIVLLYFYPANYILIYLVALVPSLLAIGFTFLIKEIKTPTAKIGSRKTFLLFWKTAPTNYKYVVFIMTLFSIVNSSDVFLVLRSQDISKSDTMAIAGYVFFNIVYSLLSYPLGIISDRIGKKYIISMGLIIFSFVYLIFALYQSIIVIWLCFALYGFYSASTEGIIKAWANDLSDPSFKGSAIGLLNGMMSLGVLIGSFFTGLLWDLYGFQLPFLISSAVSFVLALLLLIKRL